MICYGNLEVPPPLRGPMQGLRNALAPHWPPERAHIDSAYRDLPFPFTRIATPPLAMEVAWNLPHLIGYVQTWSAQKALRATDGGETILRAHLDELASAWGDPSTFRELAFPLTVVLGRV